MEGFLPLMKCSLQERLKLRCSVVLLNAALMPEKYQQISAIRASKSVLVIVQRPQKYMEN